MGLADIDPVIRYWSVIGLLLLEEQASSAIKELKKVLNDQDEIPPFAAWAIYKAGGESFVRDWMANAIIDHPKNRVLANILDWMGVESFPILSMIPEEKIPKRGLLKDVVARYEAGHLPTQLYMP